MNFRELYLLAMQDQAPRMLRDLQRSGRLNGHLHEKSAEANRLLAEILLGKDNPSVAEKREAEEIVRAALIEFPEANQESWSREPPYDLLGQPEHQVSPHGRMRK
jgi:hypothetical protein